MATRIVAMLLAHPDIDVDMTGPRGMTPLMYAAQSALKGGGGSGTIRISVGSGGSALDDDVDNVDADVIGNGIEIGAAHRGRESTAR